jgi:hypothetical protein
MQSRHFPDSSEVFIDINNFIILARICSDIGLYVSKSPDEAFVSPMFSSPSANQLSVENLRRLVVTTYATRLVYGGGMFGICSGFAGGFLAASLSSE